ncbi:MULTISPECIES: DUF4229 domain-containing protein [unclassified Kutzneria]|uniref:DUF4229 domain-containing protein n=1 Tax=unclassified Kutzneria TaxID=2621979 RepID=UPI001BF0A670|nr:DUF4229 domain-containing protein [Kutzneria sp. CA-103260]QUQ70514.1 hypothetical protein JJ691_82930 [Kutzneria sp. CA-103260]
METSTFGRDIALYTGARIGLLAVIAFLLTLAHVPLLIAIAVGLVLAWPLSLVLLRGLNARIAAALTERRAERLKMRAELRGEGSE